MLCAVTPEAGCLCAATSPEAQAEVHRREGQPVPWTCLQLLRGTLCRPGLREAQLWCAVDTFPPPFFRKGSAGDPEGQAREPSPKP